MIHLVSLLLLNSYQALVEYPRLNQYRDMWPVSAIIKMHLKNTSSKYRGARGKRTPRQKRV
jgi:hypothetical protein